jgi:GNAT superfamily N-acetyltransferase
LAVPPHLYLMTPTISLRRASPADLAAVDRLLQRSYFRLLAADYAPSTLVLAVPRFARAQPELLSLPSYFVAEDSLGRIVAAGGWSRGRQKGWPVADAVGHVRHVATDPAVARQGVGRALMTRVLEDARAAGMQWLDCLSTRTAVPFYRSLGFQELFPTEIGLGAGISFPVIRMMARLRDVPAK